MLIQIYLIAVLLFLGGVALDSITNKRCSCSAISTQTDCENDDACHWLTIQGKCIDSNTLTNYRYCDGREALDCAKTLGCAYYNGTCSFFTGCSAYNGSTFENCQQISVRCFGYGGSWCVNGFACSDYTSEVACTKYPNPMGKTNCVWNATANACNYKECDQIDSTISTDSGCKEFNPDCVTTGFGCTKKLTSCSNYTGDSSKCLKYYGIEGYCQLNDNSTSCEARTCAKASTNFTTDDDCGSYKSGCITTGLGCVEGPTRPKCETYKGTKDECEKLIGSDGQCSKSTAADATNCKLRVCSDALRTTDIGCDEYLSGCITDGQKCVAGYQDCGGYTGNQSACSFIGSKGMCTSPDTQNANTCQLMDCVRDSNTSFTTDELCMKIQKNCRTTGQGCVDGLALCSASTDITKCDGAYGSDGRCYKKSETECAPRDCSLATGTTNADCLSYSTKCVKGETGCVAFSTCPSIAYEAGCTSATGCNWKGICVYSASCGTFGDEFMCTQQQQKTIVTTNGVSTNVFQKCIWSANLCRLKICSDIVPSDTNSDQRCDADIKGCIMNGKGCLSVNDLCSQFSGTQKQCESYTPSQKCSNIPDAVDSSYCIPRTCDTNKEATTDEACKAYLPGCLTNGKGCISETAECTQYKGTKAQCDKFQGVSGLQECTNSDTATDNQTCYQKQCIDATTAKNDSDCKAHSQRCMWGGQKCVNIKNTLCKEYYGKAADCQAFKSTCYGSDVDAACREKACTDSTQENPTLQQCQDFLSGCVPQEIGCISSNTPCSAIKGKPDFCNRDDVFGNQVKCTNRFICQKADCTFLESPTSNQDCLDYHPTCRFNASTNKCIVNGACSTYPVKGEDITSKLNYCASFTDNNSKFCGYTDGDANCGDRKCDQWRIGFADSCASFINTKSTGTQICALKDETVCYEVKTCADYTVVVDGTELDQCKKLVEGNGTTKKSCTFDSVSSATNCIAKPPECEGILNAQSTDDCNTSFGSDGCVFMNSKCYTIYNDCSKYVVTAEEGGTLCSMFKEYISTTQIQSCAYVAGSTNCSKIVCENITVVASLAQCQAKSQSCWYYSNKCYTIQTACNLYNVDTSQTLSQRLKFCQGMRDSTNRYVCSYNDGEATCSDAQTNCGYAIPSTEVGLSALITYCNKYRDQNGYICWATLASDTTCSTDASTYCTKVSGASQQSDCDAAAFSCMYFSSSCQSQTTACSNYLNGGGTSDNKALTCQKYRQTADTYSSLNKLTLGERCTWISVGGGVCEVAPNTCNTFNPAGSSSKQGFCEMRYNKSNVQCTWKEGDTMCREMGCYDLKPNSKLDCPQIDGVVCKYYQHTCIKSGDACANIYAIGSQNSEKAAYCQGITGCNYIMNSKFCTANLANGAYDVSGLLATDRQTACYLAGVQLFSDKTVCESTKACDQYTGGFVGNEVYSCAYMKNTQNHPCLKHPSVSGACIDYQCSDVASPQSQYDCNYYAPSCQYYDSKCYPTTKQCYEFTIPIGKDITWCDGLKDTLGNYCKGTIGNTICAARVCSDIAYDNHSDCNSYSNLCKSDGYICVSKSNACSTFTGSKEYCMLMLDTDGQRCDAGTTAQSIYCSNRQCRDNVTLQTDKECNDFLSGCITRGKGCTDANQPCSYFKGTKSECEKYTGVYSGEKRKCSGDIENTESSGCRDRKCTDNTIATTPGECQEWGTKCTNMLIGCIDSSEPCSKYKGTQEQCGKFVASNDTKQCWSDQKTDSTISCRELTCTDVKGTTDAECAKSLLGSEKQCVTNGKLCIPNNASCSIFQGNEYTCPNFTAKLDGPCKSSLIGYKVGPCIPRVCTEAPIWYNTDQQCISYHPSCRTNGNGCQSGAIECNMISDTNACNSKPSCNWVSSCLTSPSQCSEVTTRTACVQSQISYNINGASLIQLCYWENGKCRNKKCQDYPLKTHAECQVIDKSCTSTGSNCITKAKCSEYSVMTVCNNAQSDTDNIYCYWDKDINKCRLRKCTDSKATSSKECLDFMSTCITTGVGCVDKNNYTCNDFNGSKLNCYKDSTGTPCLYLDDTNQCITYVQCESVLQTTLEACQKISPLCSTDGKKCVPISKCSTINIKEQCTKGTDGDCAWLPFQDNNLQERCIKFNSCSIAYGTTHDQCQAINKGCVSNSKICVEISKCEGYKYKLSCQYGGTDGKCTWDGAKSVCRLQLCSDNQVGSDTHSSCQAFDKSCTTDGTGCISLKKCSEYTNEKSCVLGTDGQCIYTYSIGLTTGTKSCRLPDCSDYKESSSDVCNKLLPGCISDGSQCTNKKKCTEYTTQTACQSGGQDGNSTQSCVFLAGNATTSSTCGILSQCSDAKTDQVTCNQNNHACQWKLPTSTNTTNSTNTTTTTTATCVDLNCIDLPATEAGCTNILTFDKTKLKICTLQNNTCQSVDMCKSSSYITQQNCHKVTGYNYQWSSTSNKCTSCNSDVCETTPTNNTTTCVPNDTNNNCSNTTTDYSYFLEATILWMIFQ